MAMLCTLNLISMNAKGSRHVEYNSARLGQGLTSEIY